MIHYKFLLCEQSSELHHIIFRFSLFSRKLAGDSAIYCGADGGTFGSSSNSKPCQSSNFSSCFISVSPCLSVPLRPPTKPTHTLFPSPALVTPSVPIDVDVKYLNTLCSVWGDNAPQQMGPPCTDAMYANLHAKQPRMFSI